MRRARLAAALAGVLLLAGCTSTGLQAPDHHVDGIDEWTHPTTAPVAFAGPTVDGATFRSTAHRGDVLVVNFWYQDCPPCNAEAPVLKALAAKYATKKVQFVGINVQDDKASAAAFDRQFGLSYPSILDQSNDGSAQLAFQATVPPSAIPSTIVLDRNGRVTARVLGVVNEARRSTLDTLIASALDGEDA